MANIKLNARQPPGMQFSMYTAAMTLSQPCSEVQAFVSPGQAKGSHRSWQCMIDANALPQSSVTSHLLFMAPTDTHLA